MKLDIHGSLREGFYIVKPLHCARASNPNASLIGACLVGFSGIGYLFEEDGKAFIQNHDGYKFEVYKNDTRKEGVIKMRDLEYINNPRTFISAYRRRAEFIESKLK